jgi:hypothetical protein
VTNCATTEARCQIGTLKEKRALFWARWGESARSRNGDWITCIDAHRTREGYQLRWRFRPQYECRLGYFCILPERNSAAAFAGFVLPRPERDSGRTLALQGDQLGPYEILAPSAWLVWEKCIAPMIRRPSYTKVLFTA